MKYRDVNWRQLYSPDYQLVYSAHYRCSTCAWSSLTAVRTADWQPATQQRASSELDVATPTSLPTPRSSHTVNYILHSFCRQNQSMGLCSECLCQLTGFFHFQAYSIRRSSTSSKVKHLATKFLHDYVLQKLTSTTNIKQGTEHTFNGHSDQWIRLPAWGFLLTFSSNHNHKIQCCCASGIGHTDGHTD